MLNLRIPLPGHDLFLQHTTLTGACALAAEFVCAVRPLLSLPLLALATLFLHEVLLPACAALAELHVDTL